MLQISKIMFVYKNQHIIISLGTINHMAG